MTAESRPPDGTQAWTHHWIGPKGGDVEPWLWLPEKTWLRCGIEHTPESMAARGWVYDGPCELPEVVRALRARVAVLEAAVASNVVAFRGAIAEPPHE